MAKDFETRKKEKFRCVRLFRQARPGKGSAHGLFCLAAALVLVSGFSGCARPAEKKPEAGKEGRHVYKDLKPEVYPVPEGVKKALPGLLNDNIYLYREIAPTLNLVAYVPVYSRESAIKMCAEAFSALSGIPEFRKGIEFWIIQIQPAPAEKPPEGSRQTSQVIVWGVRPSEVDGYLANQDLSAFLADSEYLLVDDKIIPKGGDRLKEIPGLPAPSLQSGTTAGPPALPPTFTPPAPQPGPPPAPPLPGVETPPGSTAEPPSLLPPVTPPAEGRSTP